MILPDSPIRDPVVQVSTEELSEKNCNLYIHTRGSVSFLFERADKVNELMNELTIGVP
jgi:hypothetical protein